MIETSKILIQSFYSINIEDPILIRPLTEQQPDHELMNSITLKKIYLMYENEKL